MSNKIKDLNSPSPWNMRIWDCKKNQWLCDGEDDVLPYYGFDICGGEVTAMQSMDWVYRQFEYGRKLIWERSTGLTDKNGKEIYEGDIVSVIGVGIAQVIDSPSGEWMLYYRREPDEINHGFVSVVPKNKSNGLWKANTNSYIEVIGNIHENLELLGGEE